jgi:hypothetical protein
MSTLNAKMITANAADITLSEVSTSSNNRFCEIWPSAKTALELLQSLTKNPIVKSVIAIVITGGDAVASRIC